MPDPLPALVDDRSTLLRQIAELGDFQPGSITSATRRCGSPACHCAKPNDPGHGPHFQLTQKVDGKTVTQNLPSPAAVRKAESEIAEFRKFQILTGERNLVRAVSERVAALRREDPGQIPLIELIDIGDEIGGFKFAGPEYKAEFHRFLQERGLTPADFGKPGW